MDGIDRPKHDSRHGRPRAAWALLLLASLLVLATACTRKKKSEGGSHSEPEVVELDVWEGVPPLEPEAEDLHGELVPKPGPQMPPTVNEEIDIPFPPSARPDDAVGVSETPEGPLEVVRKGPEGRQNLVEAIRVSFNHPMVPLASVEALRAKTAPMQIEPPVEGEFRWMGTRTLAFTPEGRLPYSTIYQVTIPAGTTSTHGTELAKEVSWHIGTPLLAIDRSVPHHHGASHVPLDQPLLLRFNQPVDAEAIAAAISLKAGSKRIELEQIPESRWTEEEFDKQLRAWITGSDETWERSRVVVLKPKTKLSPNTRYKVELPPGVYGEGPERNRKISFSFSTYPPLKLSRHRCDPSPCSASYGITIDSSTQIRDARMIDKVHVTPEVEDLEVHASYRGLQLSGTFLGNTSYQVVVDAGLEDVYGQSLSKPYEAKVKLGALEPGVRVWPQARHPGIIEAKAGHTLQLKVSGVRKLEVMASSFIAAEIDDYYPHRASFGYDYKWPESLDPPEQRKVIAVGESRVREQTITLDLDELIDEPDTFVYLMVRSEPFKRWGYEQRVALGQLVQLTNLGITTAIDRDDAVVLVTDLATGEPVANAEVTVLAQRGQRWVWTGRSDEAGLARPELGTKPMWGGIVVARKGEDEAFLPLEQGELEGRWVHNLFGQEAEDEIRAFFFTDRQPYKPGETVHLVGVVRKETKGPKGGVEPWGGGLRATYEVTTPRGVEVQKGEVEISEFGTFSVDIETDENGDTGNYSFKLVHEGLFRKTREFFHSFAVEAFRTPEFEVEVERTEAAPLFFGDELEVEVRGRYLYGAPMIGADVRTTLTRQATDFRPPAEGLDAFHFSSTPGRRHHGWGWGGSWTPPQQLAAESTQLDARGVVTVTHELAQVEPPKPGSEPRPTNEEPEEPKPRAATFTVSASVTDANRQSIAGSGSFVVHPAAYYVGLRSERTVLREDERTRVEAVVVDVEGKRVEGVEIDLKVVRKETKRTPVQKDGVWTFDYETEETQTSSCDLRSAGSPAACEITVGEAGTHEVVAEIRDPQGRENESVVQIYVHGKDAVVWDQDEKRVDLVPDKRSYEPGETAKILVRSPFDEARGFLVIEREGRAQTHPLHVRGGVEVVEVEITPEMVAGVTASAVLTKPRTPVAGAPDDQDLGMPAAASGQVDLEVSKDDKTVVVLVEPAVDRVEPGETLRVDVRTQSAEGEATDAAVALFVVDEGVLSLMGYPTPDPLSFFIRKRPGEVGLFADHPLVLPRNAAEQPRGPEPEADLPNTGHFLPSPYGGSFAVGNDDADVWGGLSSAEIGDAYGVGGLGLVGTGRGGGGTGEGTIGLGNTGLIGKGGGGGTGSGYGRGSGAGFGGSKEADQKKKPTSRSANRRVPAAPPPPGQATIDPNAAMAHEVSLRTLFATTAYFQSNLRTGSDGHVQVDVEMPENLTGFRIMAVAVDPEIADRFGSGEASVRVRKSIMLRPSLPRFLNLGDEFEASVMVDNQTEVEQAVVVATRGLNVTLTGEDETSVAIPAGESREVRFPMSVDQVGTMRLQFAAASNGGRDATELDIPVLVPATKQAFADYGMSSGSVRQPVEVPKDALPGFGGLEVSMSSTALNGLEDAVEFLVTYPYECTEQTASRLLPIFALGDVLDDFPIADVHDRARRDRLAREGIDRLLQRQNWDGGFTYWGDDTRRESWPYLSTWVTLALLEGKRAGYEVDQSKLDHALRYLDNYVRHGIDTRWGPYYDWTSRAFALWLLAREDRGAGLFDKVWAKRKKMPLYARILLMSAAHRYGRSGPVDEIHAELEDLVVEGARTIHFAESKTEAAADGLALLMHSNTQTDAIALMSLLEIGAELEDEGMAPKIMAGLMDDRDPRKGGRWTSTHANAWALMAASRYYEVMESETPDFSARIWIDELFAGEHRFEGRDMSKINQKIPMQALLAQSTESVTLAKEGPGKLYYRLGLRYAPADFDMEAIDRGFTVSRIYEALPEPGEQQANPDAVHRLDDGSWSIAAGTNVKVTITLVVQDRASFVVVDDPLPAGFEGQNSRFLTSVQAMDRRGHDYGYGRGGSFGRGGYDYTFGGTHGWWYPWYSFDHTQMRDDRMLLFADWLPAGVYTYSYTARATTIGTFVLPPVRAEAMYQPERFGHGSSSVVKIYE